MPPPSCADARDMPRHIAKTPISTGVDASNRSRRLAISLMIFRY
jgi:hypothetical protein